MHSNEPDDKIHNTLVLIEDPTLIYVLDDYLNTMYNADKSICLYEMDAHLIKRIS